MNEQIDAYETLIEEKGREYADAVEAENTQSDLFRKRVRAMEEGGNYSYIAFLFAAESVSDFLSRLGDIDDIMHYDRQLEDELRESRARVDQLKKEYVRIQEEQSAVRDELTGKKEILDGQIEAACRLIESLEENTDDARAEYDAIEKAEAEAYAAEQQAIRQYAAEQYALQLAARAAQQQAAGGTGTYAGASGAFSGSFIWPVDSTYVSSGYGGRSAPTAGASTYHQAIDISAAAGSPIYAAADGTVTIATYNNGLGNYVSIAHDGSTSTRYSHMTNYIVQPGQYVTQGQIIGYVGATGIATGNHLDFAVTSNGQQVDPLQYYDTSALYLGY
ncbi:MAG: peptidoglycan DD-metalloendopeptidase family protein [Oscillospiraceae bacterium]|nr:peptidoglycan DD-metalloendopeptidase family protein [Oscillospiraceae bacterium]